MTKTSTPVNQSTHDLKAGHVSRNHKFNQLWAAASKTYYVRRDEKNKTRRVHHLSSGTVKTIASAAAANALTELNATPLDTTLEEGSTPATLQISGAAMCFIDQLLTNTLQTIGSRSDRFRRMMKAAKSKTPRSKRIQPKVASAVARRVCGADMLVVEPEVTKPKKKPLRAEAPHKEASCETSQ